MEGIEHGAFAIGQVSTGGTDLANFLEDFLHQLEVVRRERVVGDEAVRAVVILQRWARAIEGNLVAQDVALLLPERAQFRLGSFCLA